MIHVIEGLLNGAFVYYEDESIAQLVLEMDHTACLGEQTDTRQAWPEPECDQNRGRYQLLYCQNFHRSKMHTRNIHNQKSENKSTKFAFF